MTLPVRVDTQVDLLGKSPLWEDACAWLYWVDIRLPAIRRLDPASGVVETWTMPALVGSIALTEDGRLLVALPRQIALFALLALDVGVRGLPEPRFALPPDRSINPRTS